MSARVTGDWPTCPMSERLAWLRRFRRLVIADEPTLTRLVGQEAGKPRWEVLTAELLPLLWACRWIERRGARVLRTRPLRGGGVLGMGVRGDVRREPLGRVAIIATWNYPLQLLGIQLAQALVAGNRVVVKPSERSPRSQGRLIELAIAAGLPDGVLTTCEPTREAGVRLLTEHVFDHIVFTGSTGVGRDIALRAAATLTPCTLELSGRDSALVLDDADPALAAGAIWNAVATNAGQTCMAPRRALVDRRVYQAFLEALAPLAAAARPRALASSDEAQRACALARHAVTRGGRSLSGVLERPHGRSICPLAIVDCPPDAELVEGEHFAPVIAVVPVDSLEHALALHDRHEQRLVTSVFTARPDRARALAGRLGSGAITINDCVLPLGHPAVPLGGRGTSGWGITRGEAGLLAMTRPVCITSTSVTLRPSIHTPPEQQIERFAGVLRWLFAGARIDPPPPPPTSANQVFVPPAPGAHAVHLERSDHA